MVCVLCFFVFFFMQATLSQSIRLLQRTSGDLPVRKHRAKTLHYTGMFVLLYTINESLCVSQVKINNTLSAIDAAEYLIKHNAPHVVKQVKDFETETQKYRNNNRK